MVDADKLAEDLIKVEESLRSKFTLALFICAGLILSAGLALDIFKLSWLFLFFAPVHFLDYFHIRQIVIPLVR